MSTSRFSSTPSELGRYAKRGAAPDGGAAPASGAALSCSHGAMKARGSIAAVTRGLTRGTGAAGSRTCSSFTPSALVVVPAAAPAAAAACSAEAAALLPSGVPLPSEAAAPLPVPGLTLVPLPWPLLVLGGRSVSMSTSSYVTPLRALISTAIDATLADTTLSSPAASTLASAAARTTMTSALARLVGQLWPRFQRPSSVRPWRCRCGRGGGGGGAIHNVRCVPVHCCTVEGWCLGGRSVQLRLIHGCC